LVYNIGNDASGTHATGDEGYFEVKVAQKAIPIEKIPVEANEIVYQKMVKFFCKNFPKPSFVRRLKNKVLKWTR
jgi:hypothetical protein